RERGVARLAALGERPEARGELALLAEALDDDRRDGRRGAPLLGVNLLLEETHDERRDGRGVGEELGVGGVRALELGGDLLRDLLSAIGEDGVVGGLRDALLPARPRRLGAEALGGELARLLNEALGALAAVELALGIALVARL